jgi:hypothetical protein
VNDIRRTTVAFIGADPAAEPAVRPSQAMTLTAGATSLSAETGGVIVSIGVAGSAVSSSVDNSQPTASDDDPLDGVSLPKLFDDSQPPASGQPPAQPAPAAKPNGTSGIGVAGAAVVNVVSDRTLASLDALGALTLDQLSLSAVNEQVMVGITGGVAIALQGDTQGAQSTSVAGAFALNQVSAETRALLRGANVTVAGPTRRPRKSPSWRGGAARSPASRRRSASTPPTRAGTSPGASRSTASWTPRRRRSSMPT